MRSRRVRKQPSRLDGHGRWTDVPEYASRSAAHWVVQAINRQPISSAEVRAHFGRAFLAHATPAQLAETFNEKLVGYARVRLVSITSSRPNTLAFVMSVRGAQRFEVRVGVDTHGLIADLETLREIPPTVSAASVIPALATGWVARPVTFQAGGVTIYGTYTHPRTPAARTIPAAVLLAGSGTATDRNGNNLQQPDRNTLEALANWLSADGVASLRYDKLGSGQTGWGRYAAHTERVGINVYEQEAVAAFGFLARQPQVNPSRLAVVGHSEGGVYALLLATGLTAHAPRIHAVVLLEPVPARMLSFFVPASGTVSPTLRQSVERAVASLRRTGRLPAALPAAVVNSFDPGGHGTLELSQIDRYDPATLAAKLPSSAAVLLTCSNADQYFTCSMEDRIATGVAKANAKIDFLRLDGVDHILKEDVTRESATWNQALPFSSQLQAVLRTFAANHL